MVMGMKLAASIRVLAVGIYFKEFWCLSALRRVGIGLMWWLNVFSLRSLHWLQGLRCCKYVRCGWAPLCRIYVKRDHCTAFWAVQDPSMTPSLICEYQA